MFRTRAVAALTLMVALLAVAGPRATPARADSGYQSTLAAFQISLGHDTGTLTLATTTFVPSVGVVLTPNPSVNWGDGTSSGAAVPGLGDCLYCDLQGSHLYTSAGHFTITITYNTGCCISYSTSTSVDVIAPTDYFRMDAIGDSAASGEGDPDQPVPRAVGIPIGPAQWWDGTGPYLSDPGTSQCHRSHYAPGAEASQKIQTENIYTFIDFNLLACSGASIGSSIEDEIKNGSDMTRDNTAVKQVYHLPPGHIDALTIMVGANNLDGGYANVIETCLKDNVDPTKPPCYQDTALANQVASDLAGLPTYYNNLADEIQQRGDIGKVYITEYFDPTHFADGSYGDALSNAACTLGSMNAASWQWTHDNIVVPLNNAVAAAAAAHGWQFVGGIASQFLDHGYCAWLKGENWVVTGPESAAIQNDILGTGHENQLGDAVYRGALATAIYQGTPPKTTASADSYTFGDFTKQNVQVTLSAKNQLAKAGVGTTYYAIDKPACTPSATVNCQVYSGQFTVSGNGNHTVSFFSQNSYGTSESLKSVPVNIDTVPPTTTADGNGYTFGTWTNHHTVSIKLHAVDTGSGVNTITYSASGAQSITQTTVSGDTATFQITNEGQTAISYFATDNVGNVESTNTVRVKIDVTPPVITITQPSATTYTHSSTLTLAYTVDDGTGSGVASFTPLMDNATLVAGHGLASGQAINLLTELPIGPHTFTIGSATDVAGNVSTRSVTFTIVVTADSIRADVGQFVASGAITNANWANALQTMLSAAGAARARGDCAAAANIYNAFIQQVQAQTGKNVTPTAASIMLADAQYLIAHCP
ncbi:MAG TPA: hypothetical protein VF221_04605 [Chloroflexota bacterium]